MMKHFRALALRLRMSSLSSTGALLGLAAVGLAVPVQAQAAERMVITNVEVDYAQNQMFIYGRNFTTPTGVAPIVHMMEVGLDVKTYGPSTVVVALPPALLRSGSYLLTMSAGSFPEQSDSFDVTLGTQGPKGDKGDTGAQGPQGDTGAQGPQGDTGAQGPQGDTGAQGPQGLKGDKGDTGPQGPQGLQGPQGYRGPMGPQGPPGSFAGCTQRVGSNSTSKSFSSGSYAYCNTGEIVTGGACTLVSGSTAGAGTSGTITSSGGRQVYACIVTGPSTVTGTVRAEAICCRY